MNQKQLEELAATAGSILPTLLKDLTAVLTRHNISGVEVVAFTMTATEKSADVGTPNAETIRGCVFEDGRIVCR